MTRRSALPLMLPSGRSWYCSKRFPCSLKSIFLIDHHYKRDYCNCTIVHLELQKRSIISLSSSQCAEQEFKDEVNGRNTAAHIQCAA